MIYIIIGILAQVVFFLLAGIAVCKDPDGPTDIG
jgi:hypothetical protein